MSLSRQLDTYLSSIYSTVPDVDVDHVGAQLLDSMCLSDSAPRQGDYNNLWSQQDIACLLYTSPSPRDLSTSRMPSSA